MEKDPSPQLPICPLCGKDDKVSPVRELSEQENSLALQVAPPDAPDAPPPLISMNQGLGCVGSLFFGAAFILAVTYAAPTASVIFGIFVLLFIFAFGLTIWRGLKTRSRLQRELPAWQAKMDVWSTLHYCARDDRVFAPGSSNTTTPETMKDLLIRS